MVPVFGTSFFTSGALGSGALASGAFVSGGFTSDALVSGAFSGAGSGFLISILRTSPCGTGGGSDFLLADCVASGFGRGSGVVSGGFVGVIEADRDDGLLFTFGAATRGCAGDGAIEPVRPS